jgi:hypothetical protein
MADMSEVGQKADAHRIRDLYRAGFASDAKAVARERIVAAFRAAGGTTVLDLWGGGVSASQFVAAGFRVIAVDDGSMDLLDQGRKVRPVRKRRALEITAAEDGYDARWGKVARFASEADVAFLDFCGPWSKETRRAVEACRHMKAVAVTLVPDHDISTGATSSLERVMAFQLFLKMAWAERPRWEYMSSGGTVRRLTDYRRPSGPGVYVFLLSRQRIQIPSVKLWQREKQRPDMHQRHLAIKRAWYHRLPPDRKRAVSRRSQAQLRARRNDPDPAKREHAEAVYRAGVQRRVHRGHLAGRIPKKPCPLCVVEPAGENHATGSVNHCATPSR